jgi:hypothetical protein
MPDDLPLFLGSAGLLILYLIFSAATEMGTKLPWKNQDDRSELGTVDRERD